VSQDSLAAQLACITKQAEPLCPVAHFRKELGSINKTREEEKKPFRGRATPDQLPRVPQKCGIARANPKQLGCGGKGEGGVV
jgi:hypothetical protein